MKKEKLKVLTCLLLGILCHVDSFAQFELNLRSLEEDKTYEIYVKVQPGYYPGPQTITGTGQVTILVPKNAKIANLTVSSGDWRKGSYVKTPIENPQFNYHSIDLFSGDNQIVYPENNEETLLFAFHVEGDLDGLLVQLIDNDLDPFAQLPNSKNNNPGNELSAIDPLDNYRVYQYLGNYEYQDLISRK